MMVNLESQFVGLVNDEEAYISADVIKLEFIEQETKKEKFDKEQEEKLKAGKGSDMEINVRIKKLQLNITGDNEFK